MLKKLLKYDFKAILKYWWIAAISSLVLSVIGGFCLSVVSSEKELPSVVYMVTSLLIFAVCIGLLAFVILSVIFIYARFYKNFFTDEGYLTFTIPVSKNKLLMSKLISSAATTILSSFVIITDILIMFAISAGAEFFTREFWQDFIDFFDEIARQCQNYTAVYLVEVILILLAYMIFSILLMFLCLTISSIIAKKAKIITAIGIYYGISSIFGIAAQIFTLFGVNSIEQWMDNMNKSEMRGTIALIMLGILLFITMLCSVIYAIQYRMLDRKLNLN